MARSRGCVLGAEHLASLLARQECAGLRWMRVEMCSVLRTRPLLTFKGARVSRKGKKSGGMCCFNQTCISVSLPACFSLCASVCVCYVEKRASCYINEGTLSYLFCVSNLCSVLLFCLKWLYISPYIARPICLNNSFWQIVFGKLFLRGFIKALNACL